MIKWLKYISEPVHDRKLQKQNYYYKQIEHINHRPYHKVSVFGSGIRPNNTNGFILGLLPLQILLLFKCWLQNVVINYKMW
jgi:hypothetical protein